MTCNNVKFKNSHPVVFIPPAGHLRPVDHHWLTGELVEGGLSLAQADLAGAGVLPMPTHQQTLQGSLQAEHKQRGQSERWKQESKPKRDGQKEKHIP